MRWPSNAEHSCISLAEDLPVFIRALGCLQTMTLASKSIRDLQEHESLNCGNFQLEGFELLVKLNVRLVVFTCTIFLQLANTLTNRSPCIFREGWSKSMTHAASLAALRRSQCLHLLQKLQDTWTRSSRMYKDKTNVFLSHISRSVWVHQLGELWTLFSPYLWFLFIMGDENSPQAYFDISLVTPRKSTLKDLHTKFNEQLLVFASFVQNNNYQWEMRVLLYLFPCSILSLQRTSNFIRHLVLLHSVIKYNK